ncbi:MAG: ATP-binding protein [Kofleriaceae bacterium]
MGEVDHARTARLLAELQALVHVGIWEWHIQTHEVYWSDELYQILGHAPGAFEPTFEQLLAHVHPDDVTAVKAYLTRGRREPSLITCEYRVVRATGEVRTIHSRLRPIFGASGELDMIVGIAQDITETKEVQARLVFSDRMISVGTLAGGVAHEINNPLATISASLEMIAEARGNSETRDATRAVDRIRTIVRGLTAFSRVDDDSRQPVDINRVMELAIGLASNEVRHRARLVKHLGAVPPVFANPARLGHVFLNLLTNAVDAVAEGDANAHEVKIVTRTDDAGWAIVEVHDTGSGIARDVQARIFDPFFTTKGVGRGTGLGLSICHGTVRSLGGDITFRTEVRRGTTFLVALPPSSDAPRRRTPSTQPKSTAGRRGTLLLVDDDVLFTTSLRRMFAVEHDVTVINDGRIALERIAKGDRFDVILCDLMMPDLTGAELHAALRDISPEMADQMIFITGGAFSPASQQFLERITNLCFEKPCDLEELRSAVRRRVAARTESSKPLQIR